MLHYTITALGYMTIFNIVALVVSFLIMLFWGNWFCSLYEKWFGVDKKQFRLVWVQALALYEILIVFFNLIPYIALRICL